MSANDPTGIRNKNYLNVKNTKGNPWMDAGGRESGTDERGHAVFTDAAYGVRAGILQLRAYFFQHDRRTVYEILSRWAPASGTVGDLKNAPLNSPSAYSAFVAERMGIDPHQRLDIFRADKSIGNISRLRDLFEAMAAYEIGRNFRVPDDDFLAGLELVQQGITRTGTVLSPHSEAAPAPAPVPAGEAAGGGAGEGAGEGAEPPPVLWQIDASVGRWDRQAVNEEGDVEMVQAMLQQAALILKEPRLYPGDIDGEVARNAADSDTVQAIELFQGRFLARPDGVIEPGRRTWRELVAVLNHGVPDDGDDDDVDEEPAERPKYYFPFSEPPKVDWTDGIRKYGHRRIIKKTHAVRAHAGCDLYYPPGTPIYAIGDGTVIQGPRGFYRNTSAFAIAHDDFIARYCEVEVAYVRKGDRVKAGQLIARVGKIHGLENSMLHLELFSNVKDHSDLSVGAQSGGRIGNLPTLRRRDLMDPTPRLNEWVRNLARSPASRAEAKRPKPGIPPKGFCIHLKRVRQERRPALGHARTVGEYQCYWDGAPIEGLVGQMVERGGPGDNTTEVGDNRDLRIKAGAYRLGIHSGGRYRTYGFNEAEPSYEKIPNPGLLLLDTDERTWILIHPGEDYVKSIGCLNPTTSLADADAPIAFDDSRARVIAIIEAMKARLGPAFPKSGAIRDAVIFIEGEPE